MSGTKSMPVGRGSDGGRSRHHVVATVIFAILFTAFVPPAGAGEIHEAIAAGDRSRVEALLRAEPGLVGVPNENPTRDLPLHTAAMAGRVEIARLLLDAGADVEGLDIDGSTPLDCAALSRNAEMVRLLLDRGADVNRRDRNGGYSLSFAASAGDSTCVRLLLEAGADLNLITPQGTTLLHFACLRGLWWLADRVIAAGGDINRGDREGMTPLHFAVQGRFPERVEQAIARGAGVAVADSGGATPLHIAAAAGRVENARVLLEHGADPNALEDRRSTPLLYGSNGGAPMVRLLLEHGADPNVRNDWGGTALGNAVGIGDFEAVDALLRGGADPATAEAQLEMTPLHVAAFLDHKDIVEALLAAGAGVNARDREGRTPLDIALANGDGGVIRALVSQGGLRGDGGSAAPVPPFVMPKVGKREAFVWSLGHSGWAVKTRNHFLIFDLGVMGRGPDRPSLRSGTVDPTEIAHENVAVFVSHEHADHFDRAVFGWKAQVPHIRYVLGFRPGTTPMMGQPPAGEPIPESTYEFMPGGQVRMIDGMKVTTIESNDSGVGFLVETDGIAIFHAGDHANRNRDLSGSFRPQIDALAAKGIRPDLAFLPVRGCNFGDQVAVKIGVEYELERLQPKVFFPMHSGLYGTALHEFVEGLGDAYPATEKVAVSARGEAHHYRDGKILDPVARLTNPPCR